MLYQRSIRLAKSRLTLATGPKLLDKLMHAQDELLARVQHLESKPKGLRCRAISYLMRF